MRIRRFCIPHFFRFLKMAHHQIDAVNEKMSTIARQLLKNSLTASCKSLIFRYLSICLSNLVLFFSLTETSRFPFSKKIRRIRTYRIILKKIDHIYTDKIHRDYYGCEKAICKQEGRAMSKIFIAKNDGDKRDGIKNNRRHIPNT